MESSVVRATLSRHTSVSRLPSKCRNALPRLPSFEVCKSIRESRLSGLGEKVSVGGTRSSVLWQKAAAWKVQARGLDGVSSSNGEEEVACCRGGVGAASDGKWKWKWTALAVAVAGLGALAGGAAWAGTGAGAGTDAVVGEQIAGLLDDGADFQNGFASSFLLIFFSEIGDKTFFIAALLAARKSGAPVFVGTFGALAAMTLISVALGRGFHYADEILPFGIGQTQIPLDDLAAVVLLIYFGVTTLISAASMEDSALAEEQQEAELAIAGVEDSGLASGALQAAAGTVVGTFALVFVAEWGDKSFFSTIALAAASDPLGVVSGAIAGHGVATLLAVLGGSFLSSYLSERVIAYVGGALFLVFAGITLLDVSQRLA